MIVGTFRTVANQLSTVATLPLWLPLAAICVDGWWMRMKRQWTCDELADQWVLAPRELELLANKTGATRLGFAVLLKSFMLEGRFPRQKHDVPGAVVVHQANQVRVSADLYPSYEWSGRAIEYQRA